PSMLRSDTPGTAKRRATRPSVSSWASVSTGSTGSTYQRSPVGSGGGAAGRIQRPTSAARPSTLAYTASVSAASTGGGGAGGGAGRAGGGVCAQAIRQTATS